MGYHLCAALGRALDHQAATRAGRRDGKHGLSAGEAADAEYLVGLRRRTVAARAVVLGQPQEDLRVVELAAIDAEALAKALRAARPVLTQRAEAAASERAAVYEALCARYGRAWQRHHRDRRIAHLGWRCPQLPPGGAS